MGYEARGVSINAIMSADWRETRQEPSADLCSTAVAKKIKPAAHIKCRTPLKGSATCSSTQLELWNKHKFKFKFSDRVYVTAANPDNWCDSWEENLYSVKINKIISAPSAQVCVNDFVNWDYKWRGIVEDIYIRRQTNVSTMSGLQRKCLMLVCFSHQSNHLLIHAPWCIFQKWLARIRSVSLQLPTVLTVWVKVTELWWSECRSWGTDGLLR